MNKGVVLFGGEWILKKWLTKVVYFFNKKKRSKNKSNYRRKIFTCTQNLCFLRNKSQEFKYSCTEKKANNGIKYISKLGH